MSELSARVRIASEAKPLPKMWIGILLGIICLAAELIAGERSRQAKSADLCGLRVIPATI